MCVYVTTQTLLHEHYARVQCGVEGFRPGKEIGFIYIWSELSILEMTYPKWGGGSDDLCRVENMFNVYVLYALIYTQFFLFEQELRIELSVYILPHRNTIVISVLC